ncbi:MAG TPA: hypothetical protein VGC76_03165 [Pyrinomonadaceae bacterium]|jgi:hypothetical protein
MYLTRAIRAENSSAKFSNRLKTILGAAFSVALLALCVLIAPVSAQTANVSGQLGNFDVVNHTEHEAHGFEIELEGLQVNDVYYSFSAQRYGAATVTQTATGVLVRWTSAYANGAFTKTTIPYAAGTSFAGSCYQWNANYDASGCEHFGVSLQATPTHTQYRWLIEDQNNPGTLIGFEPAVAIVAPVYIIIPPVRVGEPPVLEAEIEAPEPAEAAELYGDAQWVKVYKTQLNREVSLDELVSDNVIVPQNASQVEVGWEIIQAEPASNSNGNRQRRQNQGTLNFDTRSVIRRYETYTYTGGYDPVTHEAICADTTCTAPLDGELGDYIGAQMAAANVSVMSVSVSKTGTGTVTSADRNINCGTKCASGYNQGAQVTLTATAAKNSIFTGWGGACTGSALSCILSATDALGVTANFAQTFAVSVKTSGKGSVTGSVGGINCGRTCSATVTQGTQATFTAVPDAGFRFVNWTGGVCSVTSPTCTVAINNTATIQANFAK